MRRSLVSAGLLACLASSSAAAATIEAASVEEAARASDAVVHGRVERRASRWSGARIVTEVEIAVASAWKGDPGPRVRVLVPGGVVGGIGQRVDGAPSFADGEDVVVFLKRRGGAWRVSGLALGKYRVEAGKARPDLGRVRLVPAPLRAGERLVEAMGIAELERRVRGAR